METKETKDTLIYKSRVQYNFINIEIVYSQNPKSKINVTLWKPRILNRIQEYWIKTKDTSLKLRILDGNQEYWMEPKNTKQKSRMLNGNQEYWIKPRILV